MEPEEVRKLIKRVAFVGVFFLLAVMFYMFGRGGSPVWRKVLVAYAIAVGIGAVLAILLQSGRGGGLASLGGLGGDSLLGARSATPIAKATYVMLALFLFLSMLISRLGQETVAADEGVIGAPPKPPAEETVPPPPEDEGESDTTETPAPETPAPETPAETPAPEAPAPETPEPEQEP